MSEQFTIAAVRRHLSKQAFAVLETAQDLGWATDWASAKHQAVEMRSTYDEHKLVLPLSSINSNRLRSLKTQIIRHSDPDVVEMASSLVAIADRNRKEGKIPLTFDIATDNDVATKRGGMPLPASVERALNEARLLKEDEKTIRKANDDDEQVAELVAAERLPARPDDYVPADTHVVSESPWMVRKGGDKSGTGRMYESHSVIHRVWSDGAEDYRCRFCSYINDNPRAVGNHAARTKEGHPAQGEPEVHKVNEYVPTDIKHPGSAVRRLTTELTLALDSLPDWCDLPREELARTLAEHVYAMRPDREPAAPLTPEQIIHRITLMVDSGRLAEMHQQVERTAAALVEATDARNRLTDEVIAAQQQVSTLREERRALAAMLSDSEPS